MPAARLEFSHSIDPKRTLKEHELASISEEVNLTPFLPYALGAEPDVTIVTRVGKGYGGYATSAKDFFGK